MKEKREETMKEADWKGKGTGDSKLKKTRIGIPGLY
jgi:hypothetical protein